MNIDLAQHQRKAINEIRNGSILCGGVGTGKSRTAIAWYWLFCDGYPMIDGVDKWRPMREGRHLFIITTAKKRDNFEWFHETRPFLIEQNPHVDGGKCEITIDSWNNLHKYKDVKGAVFIFDEQKVPGKGSWVKHFLKIAKSNYWILLSATPGDNWSDYIPVFIANGFYKNRTQFNARHVVFSPFTPFPKVDRYIDEGHLLKLRDTILVKMEFTKKTMPQHIPVDVGYDKDLYDVVLKRRWDPYENCPIQHVSSVGYLMRKVVNSDISRSTAVIEILTKHKRAIVFYNFNYELDILLAVAQDINIPVAQWNGHRHEEIPDTERWMYLVQYTAGAEGWNCVSTDTTIFYSMNYSYKVMIQSAGRIDRLNTPFTDLYYYHLRSKSSIDRAIQHALRHKKNFNEARFIG